MQAFCQEFGDLIIGSLALLLLSVIGFGIGRLLGGRIPERFAVVTFAGLLVALVLLVFWGTDQLLWVWLVPFTGMIVPGNALLTPLAFLVGVASTIRIASWPMVRRVPVMVILILGGFGQCLRPIIGEVPPTHSIPAEAWENGVCPQTSIATCSAASATMLLARSGIETSEGEMAWLSLTRPEGTLALGVYRGLRRKTDGTSHKVRVLVGSDLEMLRKAVKEHGPVLLSVGLEQWQVGRVDPRYYTRWGWQPGKKHSVVLFGFLPDGRVDIGDPSTGRERWREEGLKTLWHGSALQVVPR